METFPVMDVAKFELEVKFEGKLELASVQKFHAMKYPQYRIVVFGREKKFHPTTFWETAPSEFFWFELLGDHQRWAKAVEKALIAYIEKHPSIKKKGIKEPAHG